MGRHRRRKYKRAPLRARIFANRRNPGSRWVSLGDVWLNVREQWYGFVHGVPPGARIRWSGNRITGHSTRHR
jgi:hypothetical protein